MLHSFNYLNHLINHLTFWFLLYCHTQPRRSPRNRGATILVGDIRGWVHTTAVSSTSVATADQDQVDIVSGVMYATLDVEGIGKLKLLRAVIYYRQLITELKPCF